MEFSNNTTHTCNSATIVLVYFFPEQLFLLNAELMMQPILIQALAIIIRCILFSLLFICWELTTWPANNCLQISVFQQIIFCSCIIETMLLCENGGSVPRAGGKWFDIFSWSKEWWTNDKTIIEHGYRKISWFVSASQINYLPQPSASAK